MRYREIIKKTVREAMVDYDTNEEMLAAAQQVCDQVHAFASSRPIEMVVVPEIVYGNCHGVTLTDLFAHEPGSGHGTPCMRELLRLADEAGLNVFTDAEGPRSCEFYKKLGFVDCNRGHQLVWYPELGPEYDYLKEGAGEDIFAITRTLRDEIVEESGGRQPQQINTGQCDWFADELDSRVDSVTSYELGNFYNHDATKGEDCDDATGFDPKWLKAFPQWQPPHDFTWEEAFHECNLSWTGTHIWAYDSNTRLCFDIENIEGVRNVFDLNFFKRIFDHYRQERKKSAQLHESIAVGTQILITDLYDSHELQDESEALCHHCPPIQWDEPLTVRSMTANEAKVNIHARIGGHSLWDAYEKDATKRQKSIVAKKMKNYDHDRIVVLDGGEIVDGNHQVIAAILSGQSVRYIDLEEWN